jgi:glycosyltransferase involved in cell wall biosynthesis
MLRVAHVVDSLNLGGTETQCVALVRGLAARGVESRVVYGHPGPLHERLDLPLVTTKHLGSRGFGGLGLLRFVRALTRDLSAWRPDVVQTYGFYTNLPGLLAGRVARVPILVASKRGYDPHLSARQRKVDALARRLAHATVVNAEALRGWLRTEERARDVHVIPNCVLARGPVMPLEDSVVGMVANFVPPKDHETFLRAAARVAGQVPAAEFHCVGTGPGEAAARALARELGIDARVRFLGRLAPDEVWGALGRFAVSVLSSLSEGMPNAVLEAMLAARPVVATRVPGMDEVVQDGVTGILVPPRDPAALAAAVTQLLKEPGHAARMGAAGRARAVTAHGPDRMVDDFLRLWRALAR